MNPTYRKLDPDLELYKPFYDNKAVRVGLLVIGTIWLAWGGINWSSSNNYVHFIISGSCLTVCALWTFLIWNRNKDIENQQKTVIRDTIIVAKSRQSLANQIKEVPLD